MSTGSRSTSGLRILVVLLWSLLLSGCSVVTIDEHVAISDWPQLKVIEHHVGQAELRERCVRFAPAFTTAAGCTLIYFDSREAHIYVSRDFPNAAVLRHERLHTAGYDHVDSDHLQRAWLAWKARNPQVRMAAFDPD